MLEQPESTQWYIPGPVDVRQEALDAMAQQPYGHRTDEIKPYISEIRDNLFNIVGADESTHAMVLAGGSGTSALEIGARSWNYPNKGFLRWMMRKPAAPRVLTTSIGYFGDLWGDIFEECDKPVDRLRLEEGQSISPEQLEVALQKRDYEIVTITHNDTSTGTINHLDKLAPVVKNYGAMLFVDGVSADGGIDVDVSTLGIDYEVTAPQKNLGGTPGLLLAVVDKGILPRVAKRNRGFTTDVIRQVEANSENMTLTTPPLAQIGSLALQLAHIVKVEGVKNRHTRLEQMADRTRQWAEEEGFDLLPAPENASNTVSCFVNTRGIDLEELRRRLWDNRSIRYGFDSGHPKLAKIRRATGLPDTFRIPHMGDRQPEQLEQYLSVLSAHIKELADRS